LGLILLVFTALCLWNGKKKCSTRFDAACFILK